MKNHFFGSGWRSVGRLFEVLVSLFMAILFYRPLWPMSCLFAACIIKSLYQAAFPERVGFFERLFA
jgi:hypothetical protein